MPKVTVDRDRCKGCALCVHFCPKNVLEMSSETNVKGYRLPRLLDCEKCTCCRICEQICPDLAITVKEVQG